MPIITLVLGVLLIALGLTMRAISESPSMTILIPAFLGAALALCGGLALRQGLRKHAMHAAAAVALLAILGSVGGLVKLPALLAGGEVERPLAVIARSITAVLCLAYLGLAIRSFVVARLARRAAAAG
jgi:hypothetical protein